MRICLYTETALPNLGGQEWVVDALARQYLHMGHDVCVLAPPPHSPLRTADHLLPYRVYRHPRFVSTRYFVSWYRWWLLRAQRKHGFDILHCHSVYPPGFLAALTKHRHRAPIVITSHGGDIHQKNKRLEKRGVLLKVVQSLEAADALIAISQFTDESYRRLTARPLRIVSIPNGVDLSPYRTVPPRPAGLDPAIQPGKYVLFLGRLNWRKGVDVLLQAMAHLPPADSVPLPQGRGSDSVELVIAGDGAEKESLEQQCAQLGLGHRLRFVGAVQHPDKAYLLQNALCTAVPSRVWEAFPLVVLESYAAGTPVLGTKIPGLKDIVEPDKTGWLVNQESPGELGEVLRYVRAHPDKIRELGLRAKQVAQGFTWETVARRHLELYEELLAARPNVA
ncbi:MAG: glycosyltransferase family 4 protein [Gemmataceae bacterium]|nr:glycosyltransferase family 4 protein [Gemmataceae bacterium]MCI0742851.1 glycosyltransferase family 4 protein [Gemmataceae bacterium]